MTLEFRQRRFRGGSAFIELAAVSSLAVLAALICVNLCVVAFGAWINDAACREAARAASQQHNETNAKFAAQAAVNTYAHYNSGLFTNPVLLSDPAHFEFVIFQDDKGNVQYTRGPYVRTTTQMLVHMPAPLIFNGVQFTDSITFTNTYSFPLVCDTSSSDSGLDDPDPDIPDEVDEPPEEP